MAEPPHQMFNQMFQQDFLSYRDYTNEKLQLINEKIDYFVSGINELLKQKGLDYEVGFVYSIGDKRRGKCQFTWVIEKIRGFLEIPVMLRS